MCRAFCVAECVWICGISASGSVAIVEGVVIVADVVALVAVGPFLSDSFLMNPEPVPPPTLADFLCFELNEELLDNPPSAKTLFHPAGLPSISSASSMLGGVCCWSLGLVAAVVIEANDGTDGIGEATIDSVADIDNDSAEFVAG